MGGAGGAVIRGAGRDNSAMHGGGSFDAVRVCMTILRDAIFANGLE